MVAIPVMLHVPQFEELWSRVCFKPVLTFNAKTLNVAKCNIRNVKETKFWEV